ncbi:hypothetical protein NG798_25505 [Ancylothrix sp. C2]|uniref:DUF6940 family protein n=1 Tax=Ancylothrix sp. D3o TaxID=2953691 RepID=UPI0021BB2263|nr:hypothetical protein [Ancylothrix sp. D3o]MCT7953160.1 hypothetical protein [Ancylothrix sp. D3o]
MWKTNAELSANKRTIKFIITEVGSQLRFSDVLRLFCDSAGFRHYFSEELLSVPFSAFRWETPPVTIASIERKFEFVIIDSPELLQMPDVGTFSNYFQSHAVDDIAVFPNLGKDAIMVVPCPINRDSAYGHIAEFLRNAPEQQRHSLWKTVGQAMVDRLSAEPIWLNTAGAGVAWLHIRLDSRPKYYHYLPYKMPPSRVI